MTLPIRRPFDPAVLRRARGLLVALLLGLVAPAGESRALGFETGDVLGVGFTTLLSTPPDLGALPALITRTLQAGNDFALGSIAFDLDGDTIRATCPNLVSCGGFTNPADPAFFALMIRDNVGPGSQLDPVTGVSPVDALAAYFDGDTIVLDLSGLTFAAQQTRVLATVSFGVASEPAALGLAGAAVALLYRPRARKKPTNTNGTVKA